MADLKAISVAVNRYVEAREKQKSLLADLRRMAVEECGFDQAMVMNANPCDLLDGYVKGVLAAGKDGAA